MTPVTIASNARAWYDDNSTKVEGAHWIAPPLVFTGTALYAFLQDTGSSPRLRCYKANNPAGPATWSEQDGSNAPAVADATFSYCVRMAGANVHVFVFTAATTLTHYIYNVSNDTWNSGHGNVDTGISPKRSVFAEVRSDGDILVFCTSNADMADLGWAVWEGSSWTLDAVGILSAASSEGAQVVGVAMDSTDRCAVFLADASQDDLSYRTVNQSNAVSALVDVDTSLAAQDKSYFIGGRFNLFDASGTDSIIMVYGSPSLSVYSRNVSLEADAGTARLSTEVSVSVAGGDAIYRSAMHSARLDSTDYCVWYDDANSGSIIANSRSAGTGSWGSNIVLATSVGAVDSHTPTGMVVDLYPVGGGLAYSYQDDTNTVYFDWLVAPAINVTVDGSLATATGAANAGSLGVKPKGSLATASGQAYSGALAADIAGALATVTGQAYSGTLHTGYHVDGALATASGVANAGNLAIDITGSLAAGSGAANLGNLAIDIQGGNATATGAANASTVSVDLFGNLATGTAAANTGSLAIDIAGLTATASALANEGTPLSGYMVLGSLATATAQANDGTTQIDTGDFRDRYRLFQLRPLPQATEAE